MTPAIAGVRLSPGASPTQTQDSASPPCPPPWPPTATSPASPMPCQPYFLFSTLHERMQHPHAVPFIFRSSEGCNTHPVPFLSRSSEGCNTLTAVPFLFRSSQIRESRSTQHASLAPPNPEADQARARSAPPMCSRRPHHLPLIRSQSGRPPPSPCGQGATLRCLHLLARAAALTARNGPRSDPHGRRRRPLPRAWPPRLAPPRRPAHRSSLSLPPACQQAARTPCDCRNLRISPQRGSRHVR
jgi:hypothetical protein